MKLPFWDNGSFTAINAEIDGSKISIGILVLDPNANEILTIGNTQFYLTDDLIGQAQTKIALENEFEIVKD